MPTKLFIIDVDLGMKVADLISEDVAAMSAEARQELNTAIQVSKQVLQVREERAKAKTDAEQALGGCLTKAYQLLQDAGGEGVLAETIMETVKDTIPTPSAFTLRMKNILREKGNPYAMHRIKKEKKFYYIFVPN